MYGKSVTLTGGGIGETAQVEETPEGTRVTLRPQGAARWLVGGFLALWLMGWVAGELFALGILGGLVARAHGWVAAPGLPGGGFGLGMGLFLLVWGAFWTFGGVTAMAAEARICWGVDVFTFGPDGWTLRQGVGRWGRVRRFAAGSVTRVAIKRRGGALIADVDGRSVTLTQYGTEADRLMLRDRVRAAVGLARGEAAEVAASRRAPGTAADGVVGGYRLEALPDGTTRVTTAAGTRLVGAGCLLGIALFWNGIVGVFVLAGLGRLPMKSEESLGGAMAPGHWGYWLFLTPFLLVGMVLLYAFVWAALGSEEWRVGTGLLEIRRRFLGWEWPQIYTEGTLALTVDTDSDGDETWRLALETSSATRRLGSGDPAGLRALGTLLSERAGWRFRDPEEGGEG